MAGILSNAISGLQASQVGMRTAGNNISNANVAGYSRQDVIFDQRISQRLGNSGFLGNGVSVESVTRTVNEFINTQMRLDTSTFNQLDKFNQNIGKVDKLFSDVSTGLVGGLQNFFSALQNSANDPASTPARQLVVTQIESLTVRFNTLYDRLDDVKKGVDSEIATVTAQLSSLATSVAKLNQSIAANGSSGANGAPNDLMDQRDEALRKLAELASVQLVKQDGGDINVFIGNGQPLVVGPQVSKFEVKNGGQIYLTSNANAQVITDEITGGQLGGLLQFKGDILDSAYNELGRVAMVMSDSFNRLQSQGLDLNGNYGSPIFSDINDPHLAAGRVLQHNNAGPNDRVLSVTIDDSNKISTTDYRFEIIPNSLNYSITRESDNTVVTQGVLSGAYPSDIKFEGLTLHLTSGSFQGGDSFTLQPTRNGARDIHSLIQQPSALAFAVPIRTMAAKGNTGTATISSGEVLSLLDINNNPLSAFSTPGKISPPVTIRFTSDTTYEVLDNTDPNNPKPLVPAMREQTFIPNRQNAIFSTDKGETKIIGNGSKTGLPAGRLATSPVYFSTPAQLNGYPVEQYTFTTTDPATGAVSSQVTATSANASAAQTASQLNTIQGVSAHAFTTATITDVNIDPTAFVSPLQISLNGENLIAYNGSAIDSSVPNPSPVLDPIESKKREVAFNDYLAAKINSNPNLKALGVRAQSSSNPITGVPELHLVASSGVNLDIRLTAPAATVNSISVNDGTNNPNVRLDGVEDGASLNGNEQSAVTVGGKIDLTLASGIKLTTAPTTSQLLGDSTAADFATSSYLGYQMSISGQPKAGDVFTLGYNSNSKNDNRNALLLAALETAGTMEDGSLSFGQGYGRLVEEVGTKSNLSKINTDASKSLLEQTKSMRDGVSGVNLDEEAASLIQFQQMYTANARVITVAKDLFDTLVRSLG